MLINARDLDTSPCEWLVDGILPNIGTGMWHGPSRVGKSSVINVELALAVANGVPFFGHDTVQGAVLLCLGEGLNDAGVRLAARLARQEKENLAAVRAAEEQFGDEVAAAVEEAQPLYTDENIVIETEPFTVPVTGAMAGGFHANDRSFDMALASFREIDNLALIVLDTVRKFTGGRSLTNDTWANRFMAGMQVLARELDCVVLGVNHDTLDGSKMRGSGVLFENADFVAHFVPEQAAQGEPPAATVTCAKNKYGPEFEPFGYELERDEIWLPVYDEEGEPLIEDGRPVTRLSQVATVRQRTTVGGVLAPRALPDIRQAQRPRKRTGIRRNLHARV